MVVSPYWRQCLDETLQAAQGSMLANQLSIEAAKKFRELQVQAENNQIGFDDAQTEIQDIIDGYATTISAFSPEASIKARASMATAGNGVLKEVAQKQSKILAAAQAAKMENDMYEFSRIAEDEFARGDSWNPTSQSYIRAEDRIQTLFTPLSEQALALGQEGKVPLLYKRLRESRINGVTKGLLDDRFAANHTQAYQKIINGDLGEYESSWAMMSDDERTKVKQKFLKEVADRRGVMERAEKEQEDSLKTRAIELQNEAEETTRERQKEILVELREINAELGTNFTSRAHLKKIEDNKLKEELDNDELIFELETAVDDGVMNDDSIKYLAQNNQITWSQARKLQNRIVTAENREVRAATRRAVSEIDQLDVKPAVKARMKAEVKSQIYNAGSDENLQALVDGAVQAQVTSIQNQRAEIAKRKIAAALKKVSEFADMDEDELETKASQIMQNPSLVPMIKMDDGVKRSIERSLKTLDR